MSYYYAVNSIKQKNVSNYFNELESISKLNYMYNNSTHNINNYKHTTIKSNNSVSNFNIFKQKYLKNYNNKYKNNDNNNELNTNLNNKNKKFKYFNKRLLKRCNNKDSIVSINTNLLNLKNKSIRNNNLSKKLYLPKKCNTERVTNKPKIININSVNTISIFNDDKKIKNNLKSIKIKQLTMMKSENKITANLKLLNSIKKIDYLCTTISQYLIKIKSIKLNRFFISMYLIEKIEKIMNNDKFVLVTKILFDSNNKLKGKNEISKKVLSSYLFIKGKNYYLSGKNKVIYDNVKEYIYDKNNEFNSPNAILGMISKNIISINWVVYDCYTQLIGIFDKLFYIISKKYYNSLEEIIKKKYNLSNGAIGDNMIYTNFINLREKGINYNNINFKILKLNNILSKISQKSVAIYNK